MPLAPGVRLGPYEVVASLGAGGMGEVYRARDTRLDRPVAIKVLPDTFVPDADRLRRFELEARAAGSLQHPGICAVLDVGTHAGAPYVVMELLEGETLRTRLSRGALPWRKAVEFAAAWARAVAAAHEKGIVHRDLKPENLFLTRDGQVKVLDFGLARLVGTASDVAAASETVSSDRTGAGVVLGTAGYMSPEQVRGEPAGPRSDIFSLGAVLYEMLTGRRAFEGTSFVETGHAILHRDVDLDTTLGREFPPGLRRVVAHCLEKEQDARYTSARDLAFHLDSLLGSDIAVGQELPPARRQVRLPRWALPVLIVLPLVVGAVLGRGLAPGGGERAEGAIHFQIPPPSGGRFESFVEEAVSFALSPDGRRLAFVASDSSGTAMAWIRDFDTLEPRPVPGSELALSVFWAPDSRSLGLCTAGAIKRFDLGSSGAVVVCALPKRVPYAGSWGESGTILFAGGRDGVLYAVASGGGEPRALLRPNAAIGQSSFAWPCFLPEGSRFVYFQRHRDHADSLMLGDLDGSTRPLAAASSRAEFAATRSMVYVKDGVLVRQTFESAAGRLAGVPVPVARDLGHFATSGGGLFAASRSGAIAWQKASNRSRFAWFDLAGNESAPSVPSADYIPGLSLSRDGRFVLAAKRQPERGNLHLWLLDLVRGGEVRLTTATDVSEVFPRWLPGEQDYVFSSTVEGGLPSLFRRHRASGETRALRPADAFHIPQDASLQDGTLLYTEHRPPAPVQLWLLPDGADEPTRLRATQSGETGGRFSPDGRLVSAFTFDQGRTILEVIPRDEPAARVTVSYREARAARWSPDGASLLILTADGELLSARVRTAPTLEVAEPSLLFRLRGRPWLDFEVGPDGRILALVPVVFRDEQPMDVVVGSSPDR